MYKVSVDEVKITLVGSDLAEEGLEFVYRGELEDCEGCRMHKVCNNLTPRKSYRITGIRNSNILPCNVHHNGVCAVEVVDSPVMVLIDAKKAILNSEITMDFICPEIGCDNYEKCFPEGIVESGKYLVTRIVDSKKVSCERGKSLKCVELIPK